MFSALNVRCPACGAAAGQPCSITVKGTDTTGWAHDLRILAPVYAAIRQDRAGRGAS